MFNGRGHCRTDRVGTPVSGRHPQRSGRVSHSMELPSRILRSGLLGRLRSGPNLLRGRNTALDIRPLARDANRIGDADAGEAYVGRCDPFELDRFDSRIDAPEPHGSTGRGSRLPPSCGKATLRSQQRWQDLQACGRARWRLLRLQRGNHAAGGGKLGRLGQETVASARGARKRQRPRPERAEGSESFGTCRFPVDPVSTIRFRARSSVRLGGLSGSPLWSLTDARRCPSGPSSRTGGEARRARGVKRPEPTRLRSSASCRICPGRRKWSR